MSTIQQCKVNRHKGLGHITGEKGPQDWAAYYMQRRTPKRTTKPNPLGLTCLVCGHVIMWRYQDGADWESPRFYCLRDTCQKVRAVRSKNASALVYTDRPLNRNRGRRDGKS